MTQQISLFKLNNVVEHPHYIYYPDFLDGSTATSFFVEFLNLDWRQKRLWDGELI